MTHMQTFSDFRPTPHDQAGVGSDETDADWLVFPMLYTPNIATDLDDSNWSAIQAALEESDPEGVDHTMHAFGHWATPFDLIIVRPGSKAHETAEELAKRLEDYSVLDEDDFSNRECEAQYESVQDELAGLTLERNGVELTAEDLCEVSSQICSQANDIELMDRRDVERALVKLGWIYDESEMVWFPESEGTHEHLETEYE